MNPIQKLQITHPRLWAIISFIPFIFGTILAFTIAPIFDFMFDVPRIIKNLWSDLRSFAESEWSCNIGLVKKMWILWWYGIRGKEFGDSGKNDWYDD